VNNLYDDLDRELHAVPGVTAVTPALVGPYVAPDLFLMKVAAETGVTSGDDNHPLMPISVGGPELFRTLGTKLIRGREFLPSEVVEGTPKVAVVSAAAARLLWPDSNPIGKRFRASFDTSANRWITVVGVADDIRYRRLKQAQPLVYVPWRQFTWSAAIAIRTTRPVSSMLRELERAVHAANPTVALWSTRPAEDFLDTVLGQPRLNAGILTALGLVASLLAAIGLYAIMSGSVRERTREIGVRMALGATAERVRRELLRSALGVAGVGVAIGLVLAVAGARLVMSILFEVSPIDPSSYGLASLVLVAVAAVAAYLPARRATRIDPVTALRSD
jgi:putative ABC transport system permease protein